MGLGRSSAHAWLLLLRQPYVVARWFFDTWIIQKVFIELSKYKRARQSIVRRLWLCHWHSAAAAHTAMSTWKHVSDVPHKPALNECKQRSKQLKANENGRVEKKSIWFSWHFHVFVLFQHEYNRIRLNNASMAFAIPLLAWLRPLGIGLLRSAPLCWPISLRNLM